MLETKEDATGNKRLPVAAAGLRVLTALTTTRLWSMLSSFPLSSSRFSLFLFFFSQILPWQTCDDFDWTVHSEDAALRKHDSCWRQQHQTPRSSLWSSLLFFHCWTQQKSCWKTKSSATKKFSTKYICFLYICFCCYWAKKIKSNKILSLNLQLRLRDGEQLNFLD